MSKKVLLYYILFIVLFNFKTLCLEEKQESEITSQTKLINKELDLLLGGQRPRKAAININFTAKNIKEKFDLFSNSLQTNTATINTFLTLTQENKAKIGASFSPQQKCEKQRDVENRTDKKEISQTNQTYTSLTAEQKNETDINSSPINHHESEEETILIIPEKSKEQEDIPPNQEKLNEEGVSDTFIIPEQINQAEIDVFAEDEEEDIFSSLDETNELNTEKQNLNTNSLENTRPDLTEIYPQNSTNSIIEAEYANIVLLDKNTGQRYIYKMYGNDTVSYCNFEITLIKCVKNINPFKQDDLAFFTIYKKDGEQKNIIFSGWISKNNTFTSNISKSIILLSVLECVEK